MKLSRCTLANTLLRFPRYIESVKVCLYHFIGESNPNICLPEFKKELHAAGECSISLALCSWRALHQFSFLWPGQKPQGWRIETVPLGCMKEDWNVSSANWEPPVHKKGITSSSIQCHIILCTATNMLSPTSCAQHYLTLTFSCATNFLALLVLYIKSFHITWEWNNNNRT